LAVQTRTAQLQDKVEQQQLKRLVLNYEKREEAEKLKGVSYSIKRTSLTHFISVGGTKQAYQDQTCGVTIITFALQQNDPLIHILANILPTK